MSLRTPSVFILRATQGSFTPHFLASITVYVPPPPPPRLNKLFRMHFSSSNISNGTDAKLVTTKWSFLKPSSLNSPPSIHGLAGVLSCHPPFHFFQTKRKWVKNDRDFLSIFEIEFTIYRESAATVWKEKSDKIIQRGLWMWYKISLAWNYHPVFDIQWGLCVYIEGVCWVALNMNGRYPFRFAMKSIDVAQGDYAWLQLHHNTFSSKIPPVFRDRAMWSMSIWAIRRNVMEVIAGRSVNMPP